MTTLCLGGPLDGKHSDDVREFFPHIQKVPMPSPPFTDQPQPLNLHHYRREYFGFGPQCMWVYLHEGMSADAAVSILFPRASDSAGTSLNNGSRLPPTPPSQERDEHG